MKEIKSIKIVKPMDEQIGETYEWQLNPEYVHNKLVDLEDRSRRNNLRIDGIKEKDRESWEDREAEVEKTSERN